MKKVFSVVILTYNQEDFIAECLDSLLTQEYAPLEVVISDDCSSDKTQEIIQDWIQKNGARFHAVNFIKNASNLGISENHKLGVSQAQGGFVKYLGGDDYLLPNAVTSFVRFFEQHPDVLWVCGELKVINADESGGFYFAGNRPFDFYKKYFNKTAREQFGLLALKNFVPAAGLCFRRKCFEVVDFFSSGLKRYEDWPTWLDLTRKGYPVSYMPVTIGVWRRHDKAVSNDPFRKRDTEYYRNEWQTVKKYVLPYRKLLPTSYRLYCRLQQFQNMCVIRLGFTWYTRLIIIIVNRLRPRP